MSANNATVRRIEDGIGRPPTISGPQPSQDDAAGTRNLDDLTVAYVLAARAPFDALRRSASQLAGLLVLAALGSRAFQELPMLDLASGAHAEALDALRALIPPPRGRHHHSHLSAAAARLGEALISARSRRSGTEPWQNEISRLVNQAIKELRWAGGALPGFEIVAFSQGCCAAHPPAPTEHNKSQTQQSWRAS